MGAYHRYSRTQSSSKTGRSKPDRILRQVLSPTVGVKAREWTRAASPEDKDAMALQVVSICHRFGKQQVLREVSLTVERGQCYGLLGHNGAGKTTLLRTALGLLTPASGHILVDGFAARRFPREARSRLGGLIESACFHEMWTGHKNLCVWARLQGFDGKACAVEAQRVLECVGLDTDSGVTKHKKVRAYSQGMKQRLGIAQALLGRPAYILLDEPMNGLDPQAIVEMRSLIRRLTRQEDTAVLISSHQLAEMSGLCDKVAILRQGGLLVEDAVDHLLQTDTRRYRLTVAADPARTQAVLAALDLSPQPDSCDPCPHESSFLIDLGRMKPAALTQQLLARNLELLDLSRCHPSLEQVYLQLDAGTLKGAEPRARPAVPCAALPDDSPHRRRAPGRAFLRGMQYEGTRLKSGLTLAGLFAVPGACACLSVAKMFQQAAAHADRVGDELFSTTQMTSFDGVGRGLTVGLPILMVMITGLASQSVSGEQTKGTLRMLLLRPLTRWQVSVTKFCSLVLLCLAGYGLLVIAALAASGYYADFSDLAEILPNGRRFPLVNKHEMFAALWPMLRSPIPGLISYTAIGFALGSWIKNNVAALASTLGVLGLIDLGRAFITVDKYIGWLPSAHLPSPFGGHSFLRYYCNVVQGVSNASNPYAYLSMVTPLVWLVVMLLLATVALKRKAG
jgi:ABC-2 type transport system ATP-binding protein